MHKTLAHEMHVSPRGVPVVEARIATPTLAMIKAVVAAGMHVERATGTEGYRGNGVRFGMGRQRRLSRV